MNSRQTSPRILVVTPEIARLPVAVASDVNARDDRLADFSAALVTRLHEMGADVHVALPDYRFIFNHCGKCCSSVACLRDEQEKRLHLAQDRSFYYANRVYSPDPAENLRRSLAFQREIINCIVPRVQPDLIHCHDWMTGLLPAASQTWGIPCLFSLHSEYTAVCTLAVIEDQGIDAPAFWQKLFYVAYPGTYEETRSAIAVDFLASGVLAADWVDVGPALSHRRPDAQLHGAETPLMRALEHRGSAGRVDWMRRGFEPFANASQALRIVNRRAGDSPPEGKTNTEFDVQNYVRLYKALLGRPLVLKRYDRHQVAAAHGDNRETVLRAPPRTQQHRTWPLSDRWQRQMFWFQ